MTSGGLQVLYFRRSAGPHPEKATGMHDTTAALLHCPCSQLQLHALPSLHVGAKSHTKE